MSPRIFIVALILASTASPVTLTIDATREFQTIDGFGAHGGRDNWWHNGPHYTDEFGSLIIDDLGLTITRNEFYPDNGEQGKQYPFFRSMKAKAEASGEPLKFMATVWSPPARMKTNNSTSGGGELKTDMYDDYADYLVAYIRDLKTQCGVDLYAMGLQNELAFVEPYNSCVYTPVQFRDLAKIAGTRFRQAGVSTMLLGPEDMAAGGVGLYMKALCDDPDAKEAMGVLAVHGYGSDGATPGANSTQIWGGLGRLAQKCGKPLWMTETSGYGLDWNGVMDLAKSIYVALKYGNLAAWVWWSLGEFGGGEGYSLVDEGQPTRLFYASKHFYRYIRPDAKRIHCAVDDSASVLACAFQHRAQKTMTVILINISSSQKQVSVTGDHLPSSFSVYQSTSSENCQRKTTVSGAITLPGRSLVTLYGENFTPPDPSSAVHAIHGRLPATVQAGHGVVELYTLKGERVSRRFGDAAEIIGDVRGNCRRDTRGALVLKVTVHGMAYHAGIMR